MGAQIIPTSSGSMKVLIHREEVRPMVGEMLIKKNVEGKIIAMVQRFEDNVVSVYVPEQGLKVLSDGSRIEIVAPQLLKSRTVGLCGDMNGEITADLKTPGMCVMRPRLAAITYMLNKSVEFVCISQPSTLARSLEKRALPGESLFQEISQLPTVFRKVEFEPVACKSEMSSISL